jgi:small conductance mechanosensitive channel
VGIIVFLLFYVLSITVSRVILRTSRKYRPNLGVVFARLAGAATILLGVLIAFSVVAPSFQAGDLIKILGISGVAIGFAFQNILQNFLAGLLLLWAEPFRVGDEIKLDNYEGTVEEVQARATIIETYDGRRVVIPNADLFTHSVTVNTVNTALDVRRWEYDLAVKDGRDLAELKSFIIKTVSKVHEVLSDPSPEVLVMDLGDPDSNTVKVRVLWWTRAPRQHQMLTSYDSVFTAIRQTLNRSAVGQDRAAQSRPLPLSLSVLWRWKSRARQVFAPRLFPPSTFQTTFCPGTYSKVRCFHRKNGIELTSGSDRNFWHRNLLVDHSSMYHLARR